MNLDIYSWHLSYLPTLSLFLQSLYPKSPHMLQHDTSWEKATRNSNYYILLFHHLTTTAPSLSLTPYPPNQKHTHSLLTMAVEFPFCTEQTIRGCIHFHWIQNKRLNLQTWYDVFGRHKNKEVFQGKKSSPQQVIQQAKAMESTTIPYLIQPKPNQ